MRCGSLGWGILSRKNVPNFYGICLDAEDFIMWGHGLYWPYARRRLYRRVSEDIRTGVTRLPSFLPSFFSSFPSFFFIFFSSLHRLPIQHTNTHDPTKDLPGILIQEDKAPAHNHYIQQQNYYEKGALKSRAEAISAWEAAWKELPQEKIKAWIERIPRHVQKIIKLEGGNDFLRTSVHNGKYGKNFAIRFSPTKFVYERYLAVPALCAALSDWQRRARLDVHSVYKFGGAETCGEPPARCPVHVSARLRDKPDGKPSLANGYPHCG
ncbi:hypothetical protein HRG_014974 [Hirsutella rhossiliensis]